MAPSSVNSASAQDRPVDETNAPEDLAFAGLNTDAQFAERREGAGQKPFATLFIDRRFCAIRDGDRKTLPSHGDSCCQSCRTASGDQYLLRIADGISFR